MYERFTDRSKKILFLAQKAAKNLNHEYVGTEHLLIGLLEEGSGVAANVLRNLGLKLNECKEEVKKVVQAGPDCVVVGDKLPQTPRAKKAIEWAITEARELNHSYVGTEHLLLGLLRVTEGTACQVLENLDIKMETVAEEVKNLLGIVPKEAAWQVGCAIESPTISKIKEIVNSGKSDEEILNEIRLLVN